jgi:hypothetical protein
LSFTTLLLKNTFDKQIILTMTIYQAIQEMRELTKQGKSFSFSFVSFEETSGLTSGIIEVEKAILRKRGVKKYNRNAELQEEYLNLNTNEPRRFWHCNLLSFNGQKLTII